MNKEQQQNKELTDRFPFLIPRNRFTRRIPDAYEYEYTELDMMPTGWKKAFGMQMIEELREILVKYDYLEHYHVADIKEKWGALRWYDDGVPDEAKKEYKAWLDKYENLSTDTCLICGEPAEQWIDEHCVPYCDSCLHGSRLRRKRKDD